MFKLVIPVGVAWPKIVNPEGPKGITAMDVIASDSARNGAKKYANLSAPAGVTSSLNKNLTPSASGCSNPCGPTRYGPHRDWMCATTLRSNQARYASAVSNTKSSTTTLGSTTTRNGCCAANSFKGA